MDGSEVRLWIMAGLAWVFIALWLFNNFAGSLVDAAFRSVGGY